jgi:riboflavin kinase / FMN adenylyltransferase
LMKVFYNTEEAAGQIPKAVVTTGSFDGVHIGHKIIIDRLNQIAREIGGESVLITFHPHPRKVLYPEQKDLKLINSQEEKAELLRKAGLDNLIVIPFSLAYSRISSHDFVKGVLIGQLNARVVVIGHNHHFGHNRQGDYSYLHALGRELDFRVEEIPLKDIENETVSSTKIRKALKEGNIQRANAYLDHQFIIAGKLENQQPDLSIPGFPTIGIRIGEEEKLIPPPGIYATNLLIGPEWKKSMSLVLDTGNGKARVETHPLYEPPELEGKPATLYFYKKVAEGFSAGQLPASQIEQAREMVEDLIY